MLQEAQNKHSHKLKRRLKADIEAHIANNSASKRTRKMHQSKGPVAHPNPSHVKESLLNILNSKNQ